MRRVHVQDASGAKGARGDRNSASSEAAPDLLPTHTPCQTPENRTSDLPPTASVSGVGSNVSGANLSARFTSPVCHLRLVSFMSIGSLSTTYTHHALAQYRTLHNLAALCFNCLPAPYALAQCRALHTISPHHTLAQQHGTPVATQATP
eukprot:442650-Rhodomonas_salina.2